VDWTSLFISGKLALLTTLMLVTASAPLAYFLSFSRFSGKSLVEALVNLPLVLPPTVLGFYLLVVMGPKGYVGSLWEWITHERLVFSFEGIVIASLVYSLPFAILPMKATFSKIDNRLLESAFVLGLSSFSTFFRVVLPNSIGGIIVSAILVFVHTLGEFGVVLMVGGSIPGETKVASIAIYEAVEALRYSDAGMMSLVILIICYIVLILVNLLTGKQGYGTYS
jgi:molybdate transport system permease protein